MKVRSRVTVLWCMWWGRNEMKEKKRAYATHACVTAGPVGGLSKLMRKRAALNLNWYLGSSHWAIPLLTSIHNIIEAHFPRHNDT